MEPRADLPSLTLSRSLYGFVFVALILAGLVGGLSLTTRLRGVVDDSLDEMVRIRTSAAVEMLLRSLYSDWQDLDHAAQMLGRANLSGAQALIEGMRGSGDHISWVGYANANGIVELATDGLLVGKDVSERPWFRNGLNGRVAQDVHDAVLLSQALAPNAEDPLRFIDLAIPILSQSNGTIGVLGLHIDAAWFEQMLTEISASLAIDLFLLNLDGNVSFSTTGETQEAFSPEILRAAYSGSALAARVTWPDGAQYFSSVVPDVGYKSLPNFGWRAIGRLSPEIFRPQINDLAWKIGTTLVIVALVLFGAACIYVYSFLRPLERLAEEAGHVASGKELYPLETRSTREAARLSMALALMQARQVNEDDG